LICTNAYASLCNLTMPDTRKNRLVQTVVNPTVLRRFDLLARSTGHTRASYLRHLIELHVQALCPKNATPTQIARLARSLDRRGADS
jgi:hypothetical protein